MLEIVLVLINCLCIHADIWNEEPRTFSVGKTYRFQYSSQIISGLPMTSLEYHGLQINSLVDLKFLSTSKVMMILQNPEILESQKTIRTRNPYNFADKSAFKKAIAYPRELLNKLMMPVTFQWSLDKKIMDFKTFLKDENFSVNIKRGIINMLNVKVKIDDNEWEKEGGSYVINDDEGIEGLCEANYVWSSYPFKTLGSKSGDTISLSIVRTKSANQCKKPEGYDMANFVHITCPNNKYDFNRTLVKNINQASINVTLSKSKEYFVWEAKTTSSYSIEQKDELKESLSTFVVQEMSFVEEYASKKVEFNDRMVRKSLVMDLTRDKVKLSKNDKALIIVLIDQLINKTVNVIPKLISLLRHGNKDDIREISQKVKSMANKKTNLLKSYLNVLSEVLTLPSTESLFEDFILKPSTTVNDDSEMAMLIGPMAGISNVPNTKLIDLLTKAASKTQLLKHKYRSSTLTSTWLTIGSLAGSYFIQNPNYDIISTIKFFTKLVMQIDSSLSRETKSIIVLKALGNMGVIESLPYLKDVVVNRSESMSNRVQAIYSLRKIQRKDIEIENIMLPIFSDVNEDVELRLAAGVDILMKHRSRSTLNTFVARLVVEPIIQVKAYMQDVIFHWSSLPKIKDVLRKINMKDYSDDYSKLLTIPIDEGMLLLSSIYTTDSRIPRAGNIVFYDHKFGKSVMPFEIGFRIDNSKIVSSSDKGVYQYIQDTIKIPDGLGNKNLPKITVFYKKYDNEIGFWSVENEVLKSFSVETFLDLSKFIKGEKNIELNYNLNLITNGEILLPTSIGLPYSAKIHTFFDLRLSFNCSNEIEPKPYTKITMKPYLMTEILLDVGVDATFIKSEISSGLFFLTPEPVPVTLFIDSSFQSLSVGMKKPHGDVNVFKTVFTKRFRTTFFNQTNRLTELVQFSDVTPFYVTGNMLGKMKHISFPFPFGMSVKLRYFYDVGKPRSDGHFVSLLSAGDFFVDVWIKGGRKTDFDEFKFVLKKEVVNGIRKFVVSLNHIKNKKVALNFDLITLRLIFGLENKVELMWPEDIIYFKEAIKVNPELAKLKSYKKPELKYLLLSGLIKFPLPIRFDKNEPFKMLRDKKEYSYNFTANVTDSKGVVLMMTETQLGMDEEAQELGNAISKNPYRYRAHNEQIYRCLQDMELKMPNSPSCFNSWMKLNSLNQFTLSLNWKGDGFRRFKRLYNYFNERLSISRILLSTKINDLSNKYQFEYTIPPFFYPSSMSSISIFPVTNVYKDIFYPRRDPLAKMFRSFGDLTPNIKEYKICQLRRGSSNVLSVKTFDNYFYDVRNYLPQIMKNEAKKLTFVQDDKNSFQISGIKMKKKFIIQIVGKELPLIRISRIGNEVEFNVDNVKTNSSQVVVDAITVATMKHLPNSIYGDKSTYEITVPIHNIRVRTDMDEMLDIEASENYRSTLRGVCGDMDGEVFNEFKSANCSGNYASPENLFLKSEYGTTFYGQAMGIDLTQYIPIKMCQKYKKLELL